MSTTRPPVPRPHLRPVPTPTIDSTHGSSDSSGPVLAGGAPSRITVRQWSGPEVRGPLYELRSEYVERFWLGVLGPSVTLLLRRLARGFDHHPGGYVIDVADTARAIGLGSSTARNSPMSRTLERACMFSTMRRTGHDQYEVRRELPRLNPRQLSRLPAVVRGAHEHWVRDQDVAPRPPAA
jgi:hypothetical protein